MFYLLGNSFLYFLLFTLLALFILIFLSFLCIYFFVCYTTDIETYVCFYDMILPCSLMFVLCGNVLLAFSFCVAWFSFHDCRDFLVVYLF